MPPFKHLTFEEPYIAQPSLEGLWEDVKKFFAGKEKPFNYYHQGHVTAFFEDVVKKKRKFKTGTIAAGSHTCLLMRNNKLTDNIVGWVRKEIPFFQSIINCTEDTRYSALIVEVYRKVQSVTEPSKYNDIWQEYKTQLERTPVLAKLTQDVLNISPSHMTDGNGFYHGYQIGLYKQESTQIRCCTQEDLQEIVTLVNMLLPLAEKSSRRLHGGLKCYSGDDINSRWHQAWEDGESGTDELWDHLLDFDAGNRYPYACSIADDFIFDIIKGLCYWVRESLESKNI